MLLAAEGTEEGPRVGSDVEAESCAQAMKAPPRLWNSACAPQLKSSPGWLHRSLAELYTDRSLSTGCNSFSPGSAAGGERRSVGMTSDGAVPPLGVVGGIVGELP
jgi:hypothetical protein